MPEQSGLIPWVQNRAQTPYGPALNVQIGPGDPISNVPVMILLEHHQVHEGEAHKAQLLIPSLGVTTVKFAITVPADIYPHMVFSADIYDGAAEVNIYEDATFTGGSTVPAYNRNRNQTAIVPATTIKSGGTSINGTRIDTFYVGAGQKIAQAARSATEWILKAGSVYRLDVTGLTSGTRAIAAFDWYEDLGV